MATATVLLSLEALCSQTWHLYLRLGSMLPDSQWLTACHTLKWALYLQAHFCRLGLKELASD